MLDFQSIASIVSSLISVPWYVLLLILVLVVGGGIVGALITTVLYTYRYQTQPIGHRIDVFPPFDDTLGAACLRTQIVVSDGQQQYLYKDLQTIQISLSNQGNQDFKEFVFGIRLSDGNTAVYIEAQTSDRQHQVEQLTPPNFSEPKSEIDLVLHPFNRSDSYTLRLLIVGTENSEPLENVSISSAAAVRFVSLPTVEEIVKKTARSTSLSLGPFQFSFDR